MFQTDADRRTYLKLLAQNLTDAQVRLLAWCLMTNHVHLIALPERENSLAVLLRRVQGRYSQYYNAQQGRAGHLWQNRYFACPLSERHLPCAVAYVERNPVRAGLVGQPAEYPWASAEAHLTGEDRTGLLDLAWWRASGLAADWTEILRQPDGEPERELRRCTYAGRPYGEEEFVEELGKRFGRHWTRGRPRKTAGSKPSARVHPSEQLDLFCAAGENGGASG